MEFSASVGFIHKEFITMHGNTILKCGVDCFVCTGISEEPGIRIMGAVQEVFLRL